MAAYVSRRQLLAGAATASVGAVTAGCGFLSTDSDDDDNQPTAKEGAKESPMLTELVDQGKLPALKERLPTEPLVVEPLEETGQYGGTIRRALAETSDGTGAVSTISRAGLVEWGLSTYEPQPALAESWQVAKDGASVTFNLRKGVKWSDGEPFSTDDMEFFFTNFLGNTVLSPAPPTWYVINGTPGKFTKVDETRFTLDFEAPHALLFKYLAFLAIGGQLFTPKHYLSQFHPDFATEDELTKATKKAGFASWNQLFEDRNSVWTNPDRPVLGAWKVTKTSTGADTHATLDRNPYYWKTDPDGRQLPYVDSIAYDFLDAKTLPIRAANGDVDLQFRLISFDSVPTLTKSAEENGYEVREWTFNAPWVGMHMNQSHKDPKMRELMQNIDFRAALSHAINRDEMNEGLFTGLGRTDQPGPIKEDPYYYEGYGKTFTEFDQDKANELLDSVGLDQRDGQGWRLRPDGEQLNLQILTFDYKQGSPLAAYEMVTRYWKDVGVKAAYKVVSQELWFEEVEAGGVDIAGYAAEGFLWEIYPQWFIPVVSTCYWAPLYGEWYATGGESGLEPPAQFKRLMDIYDEMKVTEDEKKRIELGREILREHDENVWMIGTVGAPFQPVVVSADLVNVQEKAVAAYVLAQDEVTWFEQVFFRNPEDH